MSKQDFIEFKEILDEVTQFIISEKGTDVISDFEPKETSTDISPAEDEQSITPDSNFTSIEFEDI